MLVLKGRVIDGTGRDPVEKGIVVIKDNKINLVCKEDEFNVPEGVQVIEVEEGTIMPGFIDQHVHLGVGTMNSMHMYTPSAYEKTCQAIWDMDKLIDAGFTTVREVGGFANHLKEPIQKGLVKGTRICASGRIITQTGGHADFYQKFPISFVKNRANVGNLAEIADGIPEVRKAVRLQFREGAEFIKTCTTGGITSQGDGNKDSQYSVSELKVMVEEAEMHGSYVAAHAQGTAGIKNALEAGIKSIEHGMFMDEECIELMVKKGAWLVPTFSIAHLYMQNIDTLPEWVKPKILSSYEAHYKSFEMCRKAGIKIGLGADLLGDPNICPYGLNGMEFERLVYAGMSPMEAIVAATKTGSELIMREDELGTLEEGKLADVTIVKGNPLEDIGILTNPENIKMVIIDGEIVKENK
ncbi:amidohydrolase family protein [Cytobacillus sp. FJAT-53684]|uniref:Amidohydrolase family protein n=1 Tax=Cytobacillus mangrovibacter TaxID=3299024 RepID=A0ABW6JUH5_9BACI